MIVSASTLIREGESHFQSASDDNNRAVQSQRLLMSSDSDLQSRLKQVETWFSVVYEKDNLNAV